MPIGYREPDGLEKTALILSSVSYETQLATFRRRVQAFYFAFFGMIFVVLVVGETLFATLMFALISIEILGTVISGAVFALLVPTVIGAAHVKLHHEGDHFTRWWLRKLSGIGILIFALGMSLMVGFSAWRAARDAVSVISNGPTGTLGSRQVDAAPETAPGLVDWISVIPNGLLFLGLSFGMIVTIYFASFCLGRALEAFNILSLTPRIGEEMKELVGQIKKDIAIFREVRDEDDVAHYKRPFDIKHKFVRMAANACWTIIQAKLMAARRKFDPMRANDPLAVTFLDAEVETIPNHFRTEKEFIRHMADQRDVLRIHNLLTVLSGFPENGDKK